jgi:aspartate aminotransferase-like enzyme
VMDEVMGLARATLLTRNERCFPISALASAGVEALLNTLLEDNEDGGDRFTVVQHVDPATGEPRPLPQLAESCHRDGRFLIVDATMTLGACELRTDDWQLDAVVAGVDHCLGAPSGLTLVTYSATLERMMLARATPPRTSYLDLLQLQAYWSADRLNHHTAPTSLVYGLREALRVLHDEGLEHAWVRHQRVGQAVRAGLQALGLDVWGEPPLSFARVPRAYALRRQLLEDYGVAVHCTNEDTWRIGLLGADARLDTCLTLLTAIEQVLPGDRAVRSAAIRAYEAT